jgi:hypothetical protein
VKQGFPIREGAGTSLLPPRIGKLWIFMEISIVEKEQRWYIAVGNNRYLRMIEVSSNVNTC